MKRILIALVAILALFFSSQPVQAYVDSDGFEQPGWIPTGKTAERLGVNIYAFKTFKKTDNDANVIYNLVIDKNQPPIEVIYNGDWEVYDPDNTSQYSGRIIISLPTDYPMTYDTSGKLAYEIRKVYPTASSELAYPNIFKNTTTGDYFIDITGNPVTAIFEFPVGSGNFKEFGLPNPPWNPQTPVFPQNPGSGVKDYKSSGSITFIPSDEITRPVDPQNPANPVNPLNPDDTNPPSGTAGPLSIDFASSFDFGKHPISSLDKTYTAAPQKLNDGTTRTNYVQVSDNRGSHTGWSLNVTASDFSTGGTDPGSVLTGAEITLGDAQIASVSAKPANYVVTSTTLKPNVTSNTILGASNGHGTATSLIDFGGDGQGNKDKAGTAVTLHVPGGMAKASAYIAILTWSLSDTPSN